MKEVSESIAELALRKGFEKKEKITLIDLQEWLISIGEPVWFGQKDGAWTWFGKYGEFGLYETETHWEALELGIICKLQEL